MWFVIAALVGVGLVYMDGRATAEMEKAGLNGPQNRR